MRLLDRERKKNRMFRTTRFSVVVASAAPAVWLAASGCTADRFSDAPDGAPSVVLDSGQRPPDSTRRDAEPAPIEADAGVEAGADAGAGDDGAFAGLILFGGVNGSRQLGDTWRWDGASWELMEPDTRSPDDRYQHALAFDSTRQRIVVFGGLGEPFDFFRDTWEWDGDGWQQSATSLSGSVTDERSGHALAYDRDANRVVLFGGMSEFRGGPGPQPRDDTWLWDGRVWSEVSPSDKPSSRYGHALAYDGAREEIVLFGGRVSDTAVPLSNETWVWNDAWTEVSPQFEDSPPPRRDHALAFDPSRQVVVLFGGLGFGSFGDAPLNDTWEWDGSAWHERAPSTKPSPRSGHSLAFDPATGKVLLFGGVDEEGNHLNDTLVWDGERWIELTPSVVPEPPRSHHALAPSSLP